MKLKYTYWMDNLNKAFAMALILLFASLFSSAQKVEHFVLEEKEEKDQVYAAENLGRTVNTLQVESGPFITASGQGLYFFTVDTNNSFTKRASFYTSNIFYSEFIDSTDAWGMAEMLDSPLNCEICPNAVLSVVNNGNTLLLSSRYKIKGGFRKGLSVAHKKDGVWGFPEPLNVKFKTHQRYSAFMNNDMNVLILTVHDKEAIGEQDLFVSFSKDKVNWSEPVNMGGVINSIKIEATAFLGADNKTLYFSSNGHKNGLGGFDIYKSERMDSTWTNWSVPENLGSPYNTADNEFYFTLPDAAEYAYLAKRLKENDDVPNSEIYRIGLKNSLKPKLLSLNKSDTILTGESCDDKGYKITLPLKKQYRLAFDAPGYLTKEITVDASKLNNFSEHDLKVSLVPDVDYKFTGFLYHAEEARKVDGLLEIKNKATGEVIDSIKVSAENGFTLDLPMGVEYKIIASSPGLLEDFYTLNPQNEKDFEKVKDFSMHCMDCSFELEDILFVYNKAELLPESFPKLEKVLKIMLMRPDLKVEISAHTDAIGSDAYNKILSQKRADFIVNTLVFFGIPKSQLVPVGYGEEKVRNKCKNGVECSDEENEYNRRVEFKVLKSL
jgi:OOP family OmpA-OmpF porin